MTIHDTDTRLLEAGPSSLSRQQLVHSDARQAALGSAELAQGSESEEEGDEEHFSLDTLRSFAE